MECRRGEERREVKASVVTFHYAFIWQSHRTIITNLLLATRNRVEEAHRTNQYRPSMDTEDESDSLLLL